MIEHEDWQVGHPEQKIHNKRRHAQSSSCQGRSVSQNLKRVGDRYRILVVITASRDDRLSGLVGDDLHALVLVDWCGDHAWLRTIVFP